VRVITGYGMGEWGLYAGRGKRYFSSELFLVWLRGTPNLAPSGYQRKMAEA
jgi:hypothetical protein